MHLRQMLGRSSSTFDLGSKKTVGNIREVPLMNSSGFGRRGRREEQKRHDNRTKPRKGKYMSRCSRKFRLNNWNMQKTLGVPFGNCIKR